MGPYRPLGTKGYGRDQERSAHFWVQSAAAWAEVVFKPVRTVGAVFLDQEGRGLGPWARIPSHSMESPVYPRDVARLRAGRDEVLASVDGMSTWSLKGIGSWGPLPCTLLLTATGITHAWPRPESSSRPTVDMIWWAQIIVLDLADRDSVLTLVHGPTNLHPSGKVEFFLPSTVSDLGSFVEVGKPLMLN